MRPSRYAVVLVVAALALVSSRAPGGQRKRGVATPSHEEEARELYKKGMTHYELGAFADAIVEFKRAYELTSAPGLLFNIAQVYRMKKDPVQAVYFYRTYLRLMPNAPNRADVEALIAENQALADAAAAEKQRAEAQAAAAAPPPPPVAAPAIVAPAPPPSPPPRRRPWRVELWSGVGAAALGIGGLAAAVALGARSSADASQINRANAQGDVPWDAQKQQLWQDGQTTALASTVIYVVGGALAATGVVLVAVGQHDRSRVRSLAVAPTPHGVTLGVTCAF